MATSRTFSGFGVTQKRLRLIIPSTFFSFFQINSRTGVFWAGVKKKLTEEDTLDSLQKFALSISADSFIVYNKEESSLIGFYYSQETKEWRLKPWHNLIPPSLKEYRGDVLMAEETLDNLWLFLDAVTASAITLS